MKQLILFTYALFLSCLTLTAQGQLPTPQKRLVQGGATYQTKIFANDKLQTAFEVTVSIILTDSGFVVKEVAHMPQGIAIDRTHLRTI